MVSSALRVAVAGSEWRVRVVGGQGGELLVAEMERGVVRGEGEEGEEE